MMACQVIKDITDNMSDKEIQLLLNAIADIRSKRAFAKYCMSRRHS
jgi:hypothetical protein